jgi:hypothetical protein
MVCRCVFAGVVATALLATVGCGGSESGTPTSSTSAGSTAAQSAKPEEVVRTFLEAIRTGNDGQASQMLTELARTETQKHELVVAPPGSETARFEVGAVEYVVKDELAHVDSKWTDVGDDGQPHTDEIIWALRLDQQGWRIAGMATRIFPNEPPLLLDFEKPEEMMQQQQMAEAEMQRRANGGQGPVQTTQAPGQTTQAPGQTAQTPAQTTPPAKQGAVPPAMQATVPQGTGTAPAPMQPGAKAPAQRAARPNDGNVLRQ